MSGTTIQAQPKVDTPYQKLKASTIGRFVDDNKVLTGGASAATAVVVAGAANKSDAFARVAEKGILPAVGAGAAGMGAALVHDAVVNDLGENNGKAAAKIAGGAVMTAGGAEVIGRSFNIPVMKHALTKPVEKLVKNSQTVLGAGVIAGGAVAGKFAVDSFKKAATESDNKLRNGALGTAATLASTTAVLGGAELIGRQHGIKYMDRALTGTIKKLSTNGVGTTAAGVALVGGAGVLAHEAVKNVEKGGNDFVTVAEGMAATTAALGGAELIGHGLKVEKLKGALTKNAQAVGGVALTGVGAAAVKASLEDIKEKGLKPLNAAGLAAGGAAVPGGVAITLAGVGAEKAAEIAGRSAGVVGGVGLGAAAVALGKNAYDAAKEKKAGVAAVSGVASAAAATGGLYLVGKSANIPALAKLGETIGKVTVKPVVEHVIQPAGKFLYQNPVVGGVIVAGAVGTGAYLYYRKNKAEKAGE